MQTGTIHPGISYPDPESLWLEEFSRQAQNALLASVSHQLRTPLTTIMGCLSELIEGHTSLDEAVSTGLVMNAYHEARRLNRMIGNLLDMTRIASGTLDVHKREEYLPEVIHFAVQPFEDHEAKPNIRFELSASVPLIPLDFELMVRAVSNVLENAIDCSPEGTPIQVQVTFSQVAGQIRVLDRGASLTEVDLRDTFNRFCHAPEGSRGLGLAVARGILEAHGGSMSVENALEGGTIVTMTLLLEEIPNAGKA